VLALVLGLGAVISASLTVVNNKVDKITRVQVDPEALGIDPKQENELKDYRNIALLGIDYHKGETQFRSDAMIIASIYKPTSEVRLFSIYRDTLLDIGEEYGLDKLNHAHAFGGPAQTLNSINRNLDLNIKEFVSFDWKAVADTVDALGGLDIKIEESEITEMNKYIRDTQSAIGGSKKEIKKAGMQHLNGIQATTYARIRKDNIEGDYRRNERMKIVVDTAFTKAKSKDIFELNAITDKVLPQLKTNMTNSQIMEMLLKINTYQMTGQSEGWPFDQQDWQPNGWYCVPHTLESNVIELHKKFFGQEDYDPGEGVKEISHRISSRTGFW
jgi:LCP family protein required for cell wall assembly